MSEGGGASRPGALVVSLDFELLWGVRDRVDAVQSYGPNLYGAREVIPKILDLFEEFGVAGTWATVGFLFADSRTQLQDFSPALRPEYVDDSLSPYGDSVGENEEEDPLRFAPGLVSRILGTPRQEVATHTYSHYYCGEAGQTKQTFRADLAAAQAIAGTKGVELRSIVFPRNQFNASYADVLFDLGIRSYRGNPIGGSWDFSDARGSRHPWRRFRRLLEGYVGVDHQTVPWASILGPNGLSDVRATCFVSPFRPAFRGLESLRLHRLTRRIRAAAREKTLVHLWWHPHNFGTHQTENLRFLRRALEEFARCRERHGMVSLSMAEVDRMVRAELPV